MGVLIRNDVTLAPSPTLAVLPETRRRWGKIVLVTSTILAGVAFAGATALAFYGGAYRAVALPGPSVLPAPFFGKPPDPERQAARALANLQSVHPRGTWIVVDSYRNRLRLFRDGKLLRDAVCSTGSGVVLRDPRDGRQWVFDTPMGERTVEHKVKDPIWAKPDWAFIEEGYVPPKNSPDRFDDFSLGAYALYIGDGYIIHGTVFQTLLGMRVTHGCVRLGDKDLDYVYHQTPVGSRVFLY